MKKIIVLRILFGLLCCMMLLCSCGDPKVPGSDNSENTGGILRVYNVSSDKTGFDCFIEICSNGKPETEPSKDETMKVTLAWSNAGEGGGKLPNLTIVSYEVSYSSDDPGAVPLHSISVAAESLFMLPNSTLSISSALMMKASTKLEYSINGGDPFLQPVYEVHVIFHGITEFGYEVTGEGSTSIILADYDTCTG